MGVVSRLLTVGSIPRFPLVTAARELSKHKLSAWVSATGACGFLMTAPCFSWELLATVGGIYCCSAAAHSFNQIIEHRTDALMYRTMNRPIPSQRVTPIQAGYFGTGCALAGIALLHATGSSLAANLAALNIGIYTLCYTPAKKKTEWNTHIGALVGALPPLIGCAAAGSNLLSPQPWLLFSIMYIWQMPHFYTLAWLHRKDYKRANLRMFGIGDDSGKSTAMACTRYMTLLTSLPLLFSLAKFVDPSLSLAMIAPNLCIAMKCAKFVGDPNATTASSLFVWSLWHLLTTLGLTCYYSYKLTSKRAETLSE